jgi:hypothetical protein
VGYSQPTQPLSGRGNPPAVAKGPYPCHDLGGEESLDFHTWFQFAKADSGAFDWLLAELRSMPQWAIVARPTSWLLGTGQVRGEDAPGREAVHSTNWVDFRLSHKGLSGPVLR